MSNSSDDGIEVSVRVPVEVGTAYNAVVRLTDEQAWSFDAYLLAKAIAAVIREHRQAAGISARELGRRAGLARDIVGLMERRPGKQAGYVATMVSIAGALGMRGSGLLALAEARLWDARRIA